MIDWEQVASLRDEVGPEDFEEVVSLFLQEVDEEIATLTAQTEGLAEKLHFLKGSALNLGFSEFSVLCQSGEADLARDPCVTVDVEELQQSYRSARSVFLSDLPKQFGA